MATQQERPISDLAKIFPEMTPGEFAALVESIREEGLHDPIALWQGQVIDGRHRYAACAEAGVQPRFHHLADDDDPLRYVLAKNALRRHLTESQRAVVAHRLSAGSAPGRPRQQDNVANLPISFTMQQAADMLRVSKRMVGHAGRVLSVGGPAAPALRQAVEQGTISVSDASRVVDQTVEVQVAALERVVRGESRTMASAVQRVNREMAVEEDRAARDERQLVLPAILVDAGHPIHYLLLLERKPGALDQAAPLQGWELPGEFGTLRRLLESPMGRRGKREFVQVLRLLETFSQQEVHAAVKDALSLGAISFDAVKHLVLCRLEGRPPRLDLELYPYLPRVRVNTTCAKVYMSLLSRRAA